MKYFDIHPEVAEALKKNKPVVALESTVISHGLPYPDNLNLALNLERIIREENAVPATIAFLDGKIKIGLDQKLLQLLADPDTQVHKTSRRDAAYVLLRKIPGATTVSATMWAAHRAGIKIFATGGIGGVHRGAQESFDISADLQEFSRTPVAVVSAGVKSILDIGATLEYLETMGVPVIGYGTDEFPAFYSRKSGFKTAFKVENPPEAASLIKTHLDLNIQTGILIANPIPDKDALDFDFMENIIESAMNDMKKAGITGKEITPFLLKRIVEKTEGRSLNANVALLKNNARLAARIAVAMSYVD
jgi:pseudouridine-5'-phosphate glycosidase